MMRQSWVQILIIILSLCPLVKSQPVLNQNAYEDPSWSQLGSISSSLAIATFSTHMINRHNGGQIYDRSPLIWDQNFHGQYDTKYEGASNILPWVNAVFLIPTVQDKRYLEDLSLYAEAVSWSAAINMSVRALKVWPRPLTHNPESGPHKGEAYGSFYSGHASNSFAFATAFVHRQYHVRPNDKYNFWWASGAYLLAGLTSSTRLLSGKHYPTDIVVGAIMGSAISYLVMEYRSREEVENPKTAFMASPNYLLMSFRF